MYCPEFIYDIAVSRCASEFLSSELSLDTFAEKYAQGLTELYSEVELSEVQNCRTVPAVFSEINAGEGAVDLLNAFAHFRLFFEGIGRSRNETALWHIGRRS